LVLSGADGSDYFTTLTTSSVFQIAPFDTKAAVEAADAQSMAIASGDKKSGLSGTWQCVKVDRQIVAIAKTIGADRVYSDDGDVVSLAKAERISVVSVADLPLPPPTAGLLPLDEDQTAPPEVEGPTTGEEEDSGEGQKTMSATASSNGRRRLCGHSHDAVKD